MKKINGAYFATSKDGFLEDNILQLPGEADGYSVIFTNSDEKFIKKVLRNLNGSDESIQPSMLIPLSFMLRMPPFEAMEKLIEMKGDEILLGRVIEDFRMKSLEWMCLNSELVHELCNIVSKSVSEDITQEHILAGYKKITTEAEREYIQCGLNRQDSIKRMKILAAIHAYRMHEELVIAMAKGDVHETAAIAFLLARSMAQYSSNSAVEDGLERQDSRRRGGEKPVDRAGLLKLIQKYHSQFPNDTDKELWLRIKADLVSKKMMRPCKGYSVRFEFEPTDDSDIGGRLIQKKSKGKEHPMGFEAFRNARSEVRK